MDGPIAPYPAKQDVEISAELATDAEYTALRLYAQPVAAGLGNYLDDENYELVGFHAVPKCANIAVKISGKSMEPKYRDGDIVFVETESVLEDGEIGIFNYDGNGYLKKLRLDPPRLVSLNPAYPDMMIATESDLIFQTIGRVGGAAEQK